MDRVFPVETPLFTRLGPPGSALSHPFLGEGSPTKIDYRKTSGTNLFEPPKLEDRVEADGGGVFY